MKIVLGDRELNIVSGSVLTTMDTGADEWNCVVDWSPGNDPDFDLLVRPRSLAPAVVSINGKKRITGNKYSSYPVLTKNGQALELGGFSKTYRLIKTHPKVKKEFLNSSLLDITAHFSLTFGLFTITNLDAEVNEKFTGTPTIDSQQTPFDFLQNLARQRGILISSDENGNIEYLKANLDQKPVGSITEGIDGTIPVADDFRARFDDSEIYQTYQAVNNAQYAFLIKEPQGVAKDTRIRIPSFKTIITNSLIEGDGQRAVDFARNQTLAQAMSMPFKVNSWNDPNGDLWMDNTLVSVVSPTLFIPDGFTFLIRAVQYNSEEKEQTAILFLVPPSLYSDSEVIEPW